MHLFSIWVVLCFIASDSCGYSQCVEIVFLSEWALSHSFISFSVTFLEPQLRLDKMKLNKQALPEIISCAAL